MSNKWKHWSAHHRLNVLNSFSQVACWYDLHHHCRTDRGKKRERERKREKRDYLKPNRQFCSSENITKVKQEGKLLPCRSLCKVDITEDVGTLGEILLKILSGPSDYRLRLLKPNYVWISEILAGSVGKIDACYEKGVWQWRSPGAEQRIIAFYICLLLFYQSS